MTDSIPSQHLLERRIYAINTALKEFDIAGKASLRSESQDDLAIDNQAHKLIERCCNPQPTSTELIADTERTISRILNTKKAVIKRRAETVA